MLYIVWSKCVLQCINSYIKKIPMFKIEYLISYNLFSEWVCCVYIEIPLRLSPAPIIRALKIWEQWCYTFLYTFVNIEWLNQLTILNIKLWHPCAVVVKSLQITCMKCRYCYSAKLNTSVNIFQSITQTTKRSRACFIQKE